MQPALAVALPAAPAPEVHAPPRQPAAHPFAELLRQNQTSAASSPTPSSLTKAGGDNHAAPDAKSGGDNSTAPVTKAGNGGCTPPLAKAGSDDSDAPLAEAVSGEGAPPSESQNRARADMQRERKLAQRAPAMRRADVPAEAAAQPAPANSGDRPTNADDRTGGGPADPGMPAWFADWHPLPGEPTPAKGHAAVGAASVEESRSPPAGVSQARQAAIASDADNDARKGTVDERADMQRFVLSAAADRHALAPPAADAAPKIVDKAVATDSSPASTPTPPALSSLTMPAAMATGSTPVVADVRTPFGSPDFASAFGLQVSLLARDGHHKAQLHLHPADMGPVSVQIVVDGTQARIDFGADMAATRQAIEAGLPELASALRDAGLTLHGGGVSSHAGGGSERGDRDGRADHPGKPSTTVAPEALAQRAWRPVSGAVDLYA